METNRLRQFKVVSETQNLRKAAELLGLSHSALSKSLKVLQAQMNVPLLIQRGRNIELTNKGIELLPKIEELLIAEDQLINSTTRKTVHPFKIATFEVFSTHVLGQLWNQYFPTENLILREMLPGHLEKAVVEGDADVGLTYEPIPLAGVDYLLLGNIEMGIYALEGKFQGLPVTELPFVAPITPLTNVPSGLKGLDGWPEHKFPRTIRYQVDMMESGLSLVRQGLAAIFIPKFLARFHNKTMAPRFQLVLIPQPNKMKPTVRKIYLILKKSANEDEKIRRFAKMIRQNCT